MLNNFIRFFKLKSRKGKVGALYLRLQRAFYIFSDKGPSEVFKSPYFLTWPEILRKSKALTTTSFQAVTREYLDGFNSTLFCCYLAY